MLTIKDFKRNHHTRTCAEDDEYTEYLYFGKNYNITISIFSFQHNTQFIGKGHMRLFSMYIDVVDTLPFSNITEEVCVEEIIDEINNKMIPEFVKDLGDVLDDLNKLNKINTISPRFIEDQFVEVQTTNEQCPYCEEEVVIPSTFSLHKCPNCGKLIKPCSMCDNSKNQCRNCPLDK